MENLETYIAFDLEFNTVDGVKLGLSLSFNYCRRLKWNI